MSEDKGKRKHYNKVTCYMCDLIETSKEHVPPKCFFPEQKDIGKSKDFRRNLITIPSCEQHNSAKSQDDMYLLFVITIHFENKPIAQKHFSTKIMRSLRRSPSMYKFLKENFLVEIDGSPSLAFTVDRNRFDKEIDHIARALYCFHHNSKLTLPIVVHTPDFFMVHGSRAVETNQRMQQIEERTIEALAHQPTYGENQEIFTYQFLDLDETGSFVIRMVFYGGFVAVAYASPSLKP